MTVEIPVPEGPPCDFCTEWPAVGSLMNLADYTTQKFCASCGAEFLLGIVQAMSGAEVTAPDTGDDATPVTAVLGPDGRDSGQTIIGAQDGGEPGSAADHWASTQHVVRSTHGHRKARGANGDPAHDGDSA